jgi:glycosyltransferase XagB
VSIRVKNAKPYGWSRRAKLRDPSTGSLEQAAHLARTELFQANPLQSARKPAGGFLVFVLIAVTIFTSLGAAGLEGLHAVWLTISIAFGALGLLRLSACLIAPLRGPSFDEKSTPQAAPVWTILIALYQEADSVPSLLASLAQLKWARHRLDIIFACEADDDETLRVLVSQQGQYDFRIVRVPAGGPRTKPNALQTALPFARGRFLTVYDAEDRPHCGQLRAAFQAFLSGPPKLAVVQAPLVTWNHSESWIAHQFALDYAIWFRVILPALTRLSGLLPLGGTSNHFRTHILRQVGGWDPYNVTEDADLGVRLFRQGYVAGLIAPPTLEEAPPKISSWVKQRGRWIQGHMQTFSVHWRAPSALWHDIGWRGLTALIIGLGIGPMSAVLFVPCLVGLATSLHHPETPYAWVAFSVGLFSQVIVACVACHRDGRWQLLQGALTLPFYYGLQSLAACRAMWRVVFTPTFWEKTDHGCAARCAWDASIKGKGIWAWTGRQLSSFLARVPGFMHFRRGGQRVRHSLAKSA